MTTPESTISQPEVIAGYHNLRHVWESRLHDFQPAKERPRIKWTVLREADNEKRRLEQEKEKALDEYARMLPLLRWKWEQRQRTKRRAEQRQYNALSREEVDELVLHEADEVRRGQGLSRLKGESKKDWITRLMKFDDWIQKVWTMNWGRIVETQPRYVDGLPALAMLRPPIVLPHRPQRSSKLDPCLNCSVKKMRCSHTIVLRQNGSGACRRCVRHGDTCLQRRQPITSPNSKAMESRNASSSSATTTTPSSCPHLWRLAAPPKGMRSRERRDEVARLATELLDARDGVRMEVVGSVVERVERARFVMPFWVEGRCTGQIKGCC